MVPLEKTSSSLTIFLDSDAFVAFFKEDDNNHKKAKNLFEKLSPQNAFFVSSNYVFAEVVTVLSQRIGHTKASDFIHFVKSPNSQIAMKWITVEIEELAIPIFLEQTSKNVSFVDCTNIALFRYYHMDAIFSFDTVYKRNNILSIEKVI